MSKTTQSECPTKNSDLAWQTIKKKWAEAVDSILLHGVRYRDSWWWGNRVRFPEVRPAKEHLLARHGNAMGTLVELWYTTTTSCMRMGISGGVLLLCYLTPGSNCLPRWGSRFSLWGWTLSEGPLDSTACMHSIFDY